MSSTLIVRSAPLRFTGLRKIVTFCELVEPNFERADDVRARRRAPGELAGRATAADVDRQRARPRRKPAAVAVHSNLFEPDVPKLRVNVPALLLLRLQHAAVEDTGSCRWAIPPRCRPATRRRRCRSARCRLLALLENQRSRSVLWIVPCRAADHAGPRSGQTGRAWPDISPPVELLTRLTGTAPSPLALKLPAPENVMLPGAAPLALSTPPPSIVPLTYTLPAALIVKLLMIVWMPRRPSGSCRCRSSRSAARRW